MWFKCDDDLVRDIDRIARECKPSARASDAVYFSRVFHIITSCASHGVSPDDKEMYIYNRLRDIGVLSKDGAEFSSAQWLRGRGSMGARMEAQHFAAGTDIGRKRESALGASVSLSSAERGSLVAIYGEPFVMKCEQTLKAYKARTGREYKSDFMAIKKWVVGAVGKEVERNTTPENEPRGSGAKQPEITSETQKQRQMQLRDILAGK